MATFAITVSFAGGAQEAPAAAEEKPAAEEKAEEAPEFIYATMDTSMGSVLIELNNAKAPISTANFVEYANADAYDGTIFHRVIPTFMIQGGG
ncbi:MAG: peptidylprolyl isomerase, partial [Phycisphaerales bacterium]|nr:peptidylprolyl isomerase [Phycisphaerales bacterium]